MSDTTRCDSYGCVNSDLLARTNGPGRIPRFDIFVWKSTLMTPPTLIWQISHLALGTGFSFRFLFFPTDSSLDS